MVFARKTNFDVLFSTVNQDGTCRDRDHINKTRRRRGSFGRWPEGGLGEFRPAPARVGSGRGRAALADRPRPRGRLPPLPGRGYPTLTVWDSTGASAPVRPDVSGLTARQPKPPRLRGAQGRLSFTALVGEGRRRRRQSGSKSPTRAKARRSPRPSLGRQTCRNVGGWGEERLLPPDERRWFDAGGVHFSPLS